MWQQLQLLSEQFFYLNAKTMAIPLLTALKAGAALKKVPPKAWYGLAIFAVVLFLWFSAKAAGKRKALAGKEKPKALPTAGEGIPAMGIDADGKPIAWDPTPLADALKDAILGWDWYFASENPEKVAAMTPLHTLSDDQLIAVWNSFNARHGNEQYGNLRQWIEEDTWPSSAKVDVVLARMDKLKLFQ